VRASRTDSVCRAQKWAVSVIRQGSSQSRQIRVSLIASQFVTVQRGEQRCAALPVPQADLSFTILMSCEFSALPCAFFLVDMFIISLLCS